MPTTRRPAYNITRITQLRTRLRDSVFFEFYGQTLDSAGLYRLVGLVQQELPRVEQRTLLDTLQGLVGQPLTQTQLAELAWRLAGNQQRLARGIPAIPWSAQDCLEWVPCHIVGFQPLVLPSGERRAEFRLQVLAGSPCPRTIVKLWSPRFCPVLARKIGYTSRRGSRPFADVSELVNLRLMVLLDPQLTRNNQPGFDKVSCPAQLLKWNREVIGRRFRIVAGGPWACPRGYVHRCYQCHVGFDECQAGTHPHTTPLPPLQGSSHGHALPSPGAQPPPA